MVNSRGIYLELSGIRVLLCDISAGVVPNGAALENWKRLPDMLRVGQPVSVNAGCLQTQTCRVKLRLKRAASDTCICTPKKESLQTARQILEARKTQTGLSPLIHPDEKEDNPYCALARPRLKGLLSALSMADPEKIRQSTRSLLGLGTGLTPSADDVLSGLLYGLRHSLWREKPAVTVFIDCIRQEAPGRTNGVSADFLCALCEDAPFEKLADAWADPAECAQALMSVGSNSGSEMLLGLVLAGSLIYTREGSEHSV